MRIRRCYTAQPLAVNQEVLLDQRNQHHLINVLRAQCGDICVLFNGDGHDYHSTLIEISKQHVKARISVCQTNDHEPSRRITLAQAISKGERMDWIMQKATELGVHAIQPLTTARTTVQLTGARLQKRLAHWQTIVIGACEQCDRAFVPTVLTPLSLNAITVNAEQTGVVLHPGNHPQLPQAVGQAADLLLIIGPEGGFSETEISLLNDMGISAAALGPRILRTETAAVAALSVLNLSI